METIAVGTLIAVVGCFIGLAGWLSGHDKKVSGDSEWKGTVNAKLDDIKTSVSGTTASLEKINSTLDEHSKQIAKVESSAAQAHHRIDEIRNKLEKEKTA